MLARSTALLAALHALHATQQTYAFVPLGGAPPPLRAASQHEHAHAFKSLNGAKEARLRKHAAPAMRVDRAQGDGEVGPLKATVAPPAEEQKHDVMRPPSDIKWTEVWETLVNDFGMDESKFADYSTISKEDQLKGYEMMQLCRQFENACNQAYMQGKIRGFMHLDNGQEGIPAMVADSIVNGDKKMSYYREHTHALASGVDAGRVMGELFAKDGGTCRGAGGSMHVYDKDTHFQVLYDYGP